MVNNLVFEVGGNDPGHLTFVAQTLRHKESQKQAKKANSLWNWKAGHTCT
jgi:hypothetical protein